MPDLIKTSLGVFTAPGTGFEIQGQAGSHQASVTVQGAAAVSASVTIRGSNDKLAWDVIGSASPSGTGAATASVSWTKDYLFWRADVASMTGERVVVNVASDQVGGGSTVSAGGGIAAALQSAYLSARNNNPFDLGVMATPATITVGPAALANPVTYGYFDTNGHRRINMWGAPFGDKTRCLKSVSGGYASFITFNNIGNETALKGGQMATVYVYAQKVQWVLNGFNFALLRFRVNGRLVSATPTTAGNTTVEIDLGSRMYARLDVEFEQSLTVKGVILDADDTIYATERPPEPLPFISDSYGDGTTSPQGLGGLSLCGTLRDISGLNVIPLGVSSSGWVQGFSIGAATRMAHNIAVINESGARAACIFLGTNDQMQSIPPADVTASVIANLGNLLANTTCKWFVGGAWPRNLNLSASLLATDAAIIAGINALASDRVAFIDINGAQGGLPWVTGTRDADTATGTAGNSRYITGNDGIHLAAGDGTTFFARKITDALIAQASAKGW